MEYILVIILICYIAFIHYKMSKKNQLIEAMVEKLGKLEKDWETNHVLTLLEKYRQQQNEPILIHNKLFDEPVLKFLFSNEKDSKIFVHYTKDEYTAKRISNEGLLFTDSFEKTAEQVINDDIDLNYKHNVRKYFGKFIVVICIPNEIYNYYSQELRLLNRSNKQPEQVLSGIPSYFDENDDEVFTLSKQYIKGYINYETGVTFSNPEFIRTIKPYLSQNQLN